MDNLIDWFYGQIVGFLGNFFSAMGNMGVEIFELEWVQAIVLFFSQLGWALYGVSLVVCAFEFGIEYTTGRANLQHTALGAIKGFLAVSLFTILPVRLYALSVSLQGQLSAGLTGYGTSIGDVGQQIITDLGSVESIADMTQVTLDFGFGVITSPIMLLFCIILMAYAVSIEAMDDRILNFYVVPCFNVDEVFGTFVETDENDHALNIYANYDMQRQQVCDTLEMTLYGSGIEDQSLTYHLNAAEKEVLHEKMKAYCMQREHKPLEQLCQEILQEQDAPTQEMQL